MPTAYCILPALPCTAQNPDSVISYARKIIDTLASPSMHGRGYVNKGDSLAAEYIRKEFENLEIKPLGTEFRQRFHFSVNTFPEEMQLSIDGKKMQPGKDYLIDPGSSGKHGKLKLVCLDKNNISTFSWSKRSKYDNGFFGKRVILVDTSGFSFKEKKMVGPYYTDDCWSCPPRIFITDKKFTWELSTDESQFCRLTVQKSALPNNPKRVRFNITNVKAEHSSANVLGCIKGTEYPDSFLVFSAHYDHLGQMGKDVYFPGANDNASGCAMLLSLARYYSQHPQKYSIAFMAFGGEEAGLVGSKYYVQHPLFPLKQIKFLINMDIMGTGDEGIKVVNAVQHKKEFDELVRINSEKNLLPSVQPRGKAANSDHYFFEEAGVKTFFIYTLGGIKAYHDIYDRPETLPLTKFAEVYQLLIGFTDSLQK